MFEKLFGLTAMPFCFQCFARKSCRYFDAAQYAGTDSSWVGKTSGPGETRGQRYEAKAWSNPLWGKGPSISFQLQLVNSHLWALPKWQLTTCTCPADVCYTLHLPGWTAAIVGTWSRQQTWLQSNNNWRLLIEGTARSSVCNCQRSSLCATITVIPWHVPTGSGWHNICRKFRDNELKLVSWTCNGWKLEVPK